MIECETGVHTRFNSAVCIKHVCCGMQVGVAPEAGDIVWTPDTTLRYPLLCSGAGVIAGMFGVGGGIVKGPLMLHLGVLPEVAAATSATMILFTSCAISALSAALNTTREVQCGCVLVFQFSVCCA